MNITSDGLLGESYKKNIASRLRTSRVTILIAVMLISLLSAMAPAAASAEAWSPPRTVYLPSTGHTIDGLFLDAWRSYPALLGAPITEEFEQKTEIGDDPTNIVQYYENVALAYLPKLDDDWQVQALQLGRLALERDLRASNHDEKLRAAEAVRGDCGSLSAEECVQFEETDHTLRLGFKTFWDGHGGLQLLGLPLTEEFVAKDGYTTQYFERAVLRWKEGETVTLRPLGREFVDQRKIATDPISQPLNVPIYDEALFIPPEPAIGGVGPGPQQGGAKEIVVSISAQAMWAYENGEQVMFSYVSTGRPGFDTPLGYYSVLVKYESETMEGVIGGEYYNVPDVPWVLYFTNYGHALHGTYWHSNFGAVMSHGCVNLPMDVASFIYSWAPIGTPVSIIG